MTLMKDSDSGVILVVEDDDAARHTLSNVLGDKGYKIIEAVNGQAGLEVALKERPDIILSDNIMPLKSGIEMLMEIRADDEWGANVPAILLTSSYDIGVMNESLTIGNTDYLIKDETSIADISNAIHKWLSERRAN